jgi:pSer/pThr/pTyr-binding forkhead associated (FHA) protein
LKRRFSGTAWPFAIVVCVALLAFRASAQEGLELLTVLPASAGRADALVYMSDAQLRHDLQAGLGPGQFRVVTGQGQAHVQSVQRIADTNERVFTVLAFDASGSFAPYWRDAIVLARSFADGMPAGRPQAIRLVTFGLKLDDLGTATSRQDLDILLTSLARKKPDQSATRLKAFVRQAAKIAADEQPLSNRGVRQVIVFTDAGEESTAYDVKSIAADALSLGVQVHVVAFYRKGHRQGSLARLLDEMRQLAENTGGRSIQVDNVNDATGAVRQLAVAPFDAAWLTIEFCGVPAGQVHFEDTISLEAFRNGARVAFSAPRRFRQEASGGAIATCRPCQPPCQAGSSCIDGVCTAASPATAVTKQSASRGAASWWLLAFFIAAAAAVMLLIARRSRPPPAPSAEQAVAAPAPPPLPPEPPPEPAPAPTTAWQNPLEPLPFTRLVLLEGSSPAAPSFITLNKRETIVGGDPGNVDEPVQVQQVSARHALFELFRNGSVFVTDLGSSNGTWVDGRKLASGERCRLSAGQIVELSRRVKLRLESSTQDRGLAAAPVQTQASRAAPATAETAPSQEPTRRAKARTIYAPINKKPDDQ